MHSDSTSHNFIVGIPRSGTTLISYVLNRNQNALVPPENLLTMNVIRDFEENPGSLTQTKLYIQNKTHKLKDTPYEVDHEVLNRVLSQKINQVSVTSTEILKTFRFLDKSYDNINCIIEKKPNYSFRLFKLKQYFPEAKYLWMTRDYKAFVNSRIEKKNPKNKMDHPLYLGYHWNEHHRQLNAFKVGNSKNIKVVRYEDLVTNQEETLSLICSFFGLIFSAEMLRTEEWNVKEKVEYHTSRKKVKYEDLSEKINDKRIASWKENIKPSVVHKLDVICGKYGSELGYSAQGEYSKGYVFWVKVSTLHWYLLARLSSIMVKRQTK